jgi:hypothetical protein
MVKSMRFPILRLADFPFSALTYPGRRPRFSFFFTHRGIYRCSLRSMNELLTARHLAPVSERIPVLAYGSNACPSQLFRKYNQDSRLTDIPVVYGRINNADVVYSRRITQGGYVPATLVRARRSLPSWITLLTPEQLRAMDSTEGRPNLYQLVEVPRLKFFAGRLQISPLFSYLDVSGGVMIFKRRPVSLRTVRQKKCQSIFQSTTRHDAQRWLAFTQVPASETPETRAQLSVAR